MNAGDPVPAVHRQDARSNDFRVVLGGDYAGKSAVLSQLPPHQWRVVSYDDPYIVDFPVVRRLRSTLFFEAYRRLGRPYSAELTFSLLNPVVWFLRDEMSRSCRLGPTVVDSYYYKLLAKGIVSGIADPATIALWRSFPQPRGVVFLDLDPELAWERAGSADNLNGFEHYGPRASRDSFVGFQHDLRAVMLHEVAGLPVTMVDANRPPAAVARDVRAALRDLAYGAAR